jgi:cation transport ATPase
MGTGADVAIESADITLVKFRRPLTKMAENYSPMDKAKALQIIRATHARGGIFERPAAENPGSARE